MSQKPNHSSSSYEEEEDSGSEDEQTSGSDSDTDSGPQPNPNPKKTPTVPSQPVNKPLPYHPSSEYTDSDSDSDLPPKKPANKPQQIRNVDSKIVIKRPKLPPPRVPPVVEKEANKPKPGASIVSESDSEDESDSESDNDSNIKPVSLKKPIETKSVEKTKSEPALIITPVQTQAKSNKRPLITASPVVEKEVKKIKQDKVDGSSGNKLKPIRQGLSVSGSETEESGSGTDTDSDSARKKSKKVKPVDAKPMGLKSVEKAGSKAVTEKNKLSVMVSGKNESEGEKKSGGQEEEAKKQLFQRLWSEDDEIAVLEGMIGYKNANGENALADMGAFHEFIKRKLHVDVSRAQVVDKIRRLKKKYVNNASREKHGKDRSFSKSHEQKAYELSKLIWGSKSNGNSNSNSNSNNKNPTSGPESKKKSQSQKSGKLKGNAASTSTGAGTGLVTSNGVDDKDKAMMEVEKNIDISRFVKYGGMSGSPIVSEEIVKGGLELVEGSKRAELEAKWRKLKEQELEIYVKRMELLREQALVILDAVRASGN